MPLVITPFSSPHDLQPMVDLLLAVRPPQRINHWPGVVELYEVLGRATVTVNTRLWWDGERLAAWAFVDEFDNIHFESRHGALTCADFAAMFEWACAVVAARSGPGEATLDASAHEEDTERVALLLAHGFVEGTHRTLGYVRELSGAIPAPPVPPGFTLRPLRSDEVEAAAALHRAAFGTDYMTVENRRAMMSGPEYDPAGDLVVVAPDGRLAAYTMASISATENAVSGVAEGFTDPVATHPDFRRLGLAKSLMLAGCVRLQALGATRARLGTSSENAGMQRAAESAGYRLDHAVRWFSRPLRA